MLADGSAYAALGAERGFALPPLLRAGVLVEQRRRDKRKLRVAHFTTLTGSAGIWGPSSLNSAVLAASEINAQGGILGREIELEVHDAGSVSADLVRTASDLVEGNEVDVVMGSHMSAVRMQLRKIFAGRLPYVYTPIYEGGEHTPGVLVIGETPARQARPAIAWLAERDATATARHSRCRSGTSAWRACVLLGIGADNTANLFAASGYFNTGRSPATEAFLDAYQTAFGPCAPPPGSTAQSNYEGLYFLEALARRAGALGLPGLTAAAEGVVYHAACGPVGMRHHRTEMPIYLGEADGFDFRLRAEF